MGSGLVGCSPLQKGLGFRGLGGDSGRDRLWYILAYVRQSYHLYVLFVLNRYDLPHLLIMFSWSTFINYVIRFLLVAAPKICQAQVYRYMCACAGLLFAFMLMGRAEGREGEALRSSRRRGSRSTRERERLRQAFGPEERKKERTKKERNRETEKEAETARERERERDTEEEGREKRVRQHQHSSGSCSHRAEPPTAALDSGVGSSARGPPRPQRGRKKNKNNKKKRRERVREREKDRGRGTEGEGHRKIVKGKYRDT